MIKCYRDSIGICRADSKDVHRLVGTYLEQDLQGSLIMCNELMSTINEIECGARREWSGTGNAHTITIRADGVSIKNDWDDSLGIAEISLNLFRQCVEAWRRCVSM